MTVIELSIVTALLGVVLATLLGVLNSMTSNEQAQQAKIDSQERVRLAMGQLTRDLRSSNPLLAATSAGAGAASLEMAHGSPAGQTFVRWQLADTTLTRSVLASDGGVATSTKVVLTDVRNTTLGLTLFRYFRSSGAEMAVTGASAVTANDVANCTVRVKVTVAAGTASGSPPFFEETDAAIRNRLPGGLGC